MTYDGILDSGANTLPQWMADIPLLYNVAGMINDMRVEVVAAAYEELGRVTSKPTFLYTPTLDQQARPHGPHPTSNRNSRTLTLTRTEPEPNPNRTLIPTLS